MRLVDSHGHVNADRFADDVDEVLAAAREAGVERLLVPGWNVASSERAVDLVERHPWLHASVGVHPHDAAKVDDAGWARIVELADEPVVVAIGETGLDYDRAFSPVDAQLANLRRNLALAVATGKPAILHCRSAPGRRDAQDTLVDELRSVLSPPGAREAFAARPPAVLHSFSGPVDYAEAMVDLGLAVSFSGLVFRAGEEASSDVVRLVPSERLLVETDAPFLSPPGAPRSRNEPRWVAITAAWVAERRAEPAERVGEALVDAYCRTFGGPVAE
ncbi:MAG TPA: TatD family hydrolase [Candidatus Dormibacteraeota bacterium]|nr:TatD family hydrolase [Candidatus Dormibacteraeota bacterium]